MAKRKQQHSRIMAQHEAIKRQYPDVLLFFHVGGDWYALETDARAAAPILGIEVGPISGPFGPGVVHGCSVPHAGAESAFRRLVAAGHKVAACEQMGWTK